MSVKQLQDGRWQARTYVGKTAAGKSRLKSETFDTKKEALEFESQIKNLRENRVDVNVSNRALFPLVAERYFEESSITGNTLKTYRTNYENWIKPKLEYSQIGKVTSHKLKEVLKEIGHEAGDSTLAMCVTVIKQIFKYATESEERFIVLNPSSNLERPEIDTPGIGPNDYWTIEEVGLFLLEAKKSPHYLEFLLALNTGPRVAELVAIEPYQFDFKAGVMRFSQQVQPFQPKNEFERKFKAHDELKITKSKRTRIAPVPAHVLELVKSQIESIGENRFLFFPGKTESKKILIRSSGKLAVHEERYINPRTLAYVMKRICETAKVKYIGPHGLRHTFAAHYLMGGGNIYSLSKILGHSSVAVTQQNYGHLSPEFLKQSSIVFFGVDTK